MTSSMLLLQRLRRRRWIRSQNCSPRLAYLTTTGPEAGVVRGAWRAQTRTASGLPHPRRAKQAANETDMLAPTPASLAVIPLDVVNPTY